MRPGGGAAQSTQGDLRPFGCTLHPGPSRPSALVWNFYACSIPEGRARRGTYPGVKLALGLLRLVLMLAVIIIPN